MQEFSEKHTRSINSLAQMTEAKLIDLKGLFHGSRNHVPVRTTIVNDLNEEEEVVIKQIIQKLNNLLKDYCTRYNVKQTQLRLKKEIL